MDASGSDFLMVDDKSQSNSISGLKSNRSNQSLITEKSRLSDYAKKAIKQVTDYNQFLNQARKEQRSVSMDLQTYTINYPVGLGVDNKTLRRNSKAGRIYKAGKYPVAVIHGQYQDWFVPYTTEELKYFPLNTVIYGPVITDTTKIPPLPEDGSSAESESDSEEENDGDEEDDDYSSCSSQECVRKSKKFKQEQESDSESSDSESQTYSHDSNSRNTTRSSCIKRFEGN